MKVLHVISDLNIGGAQILAADILPALKKENADAELLVCETICKDNNLMKHLNDENIKVYNLNTNVRNPLVIFKLLKYFKKYDVVHVHLFPLIYFSALASVFCRTPMVYTEHNTNNRRRDKKYLRPIERWMYSRYKKIISISAKTQDALQQWLGENDERFVMVENGVDLSKFDGKNDKERKNQIVMISRFAPAKDQATLIKAMQWVNPEYRLALVGDGENLENCKKLAEELGLGSRVDFLGARNDVPSILKKSKIGVQSSHWEGFGLTAIEMMASGLPVIASDVDGLKQVVEGAGIIFGKGDDKALAESINKLIEDNNYYNKVRNDCMELSLKYDFRNTAAKYAEIYRTIS